MNEVGYLQASEKTISKNQGGKTTRKDTKPRSLTLCPFTLAVHSITLTDIRLNLLAVFHRNLSRE